jgi:hypothetical protein
MTSFIVVAFVLAGIMLDKQNDIDETVPGTGDESEPTTDWNHDGYPP